MTIKSPELHKKKIIVKYFVCRTCGCGGDRRNQETWRRTEKPYGRRYIFGLVWQTKATWDPLSLRTIKNKLYETICTLSWYGKADAINHSESHLTYPRVTHWQREKSTLKLEKNCYKIIRYEMAGSNMSGENNGNSLTWPKTWCWWSGRPGFMPFTSPISIWISKQSFCVLHPMRLGQW